MPAIQPKWILPPEVVLLEEVATEGNIDTTHDGATRLAEEVTQLELAVLREAVLGEDHQLVGDSPSLDIPLVLAPTGQGDGDGLTTTVDDGSVEDLAGDHLADSHVGDGVVVHAEPGVRDLAGDHATTTHVVLHLSHPGRHAGIVGSVDLDGVRLEDASVVGAVDLDGDPLGGSVVGTVDGDRGTLAVRVVGAVDAHPLAGDDAGVVGAVDVGGDAVAGEAVRAIDVHVVGHC